MLIRTAAAALVVVMSMVVLACNDLPTSTGDVLVPGTDSLYAKSSLNDSIMENLLTTSDRIPIYNNTYVLFGKTTDSEARVIYQLVEFPKLGDSQNWEVTSSEMIFLPQDYLFGDTTNLTLAITAYDLKQEWSDNATWDSIWAPDGSTSYYSTADQPVCTFTKDLATTDSIVYVPFSLEATERWLTLGGDSATKDQVYGVVLLPSGGSSIRQYRNLNGNSQVMQMRIGVKHKDSTNVDTMFLDAVAAAFVNTPDAPTGEVVIQGARVHRASFDVRIDSLPQYAILLGASFTVTVDKERSTIGTLGLDELLDLTYTATSGSRVTVSARGDNAGTYQFVNIVPILYEMRKDGGRGTMILNPTGGNERWRMNRLHLYGMDADTTLRPRLKIVYSVPTVLQ